MAEVYRNARQNSNDAQRRFFSAKKTAILQILLAL